MENPHGADACMLVTTLKSLIGPLEMSRAHIFMTRTDPSRHNKPLTQSLVVAPKFWPVPSPAYKEGSADFAIILVHKINCGK